MATITNIINTNNKEIDIQSSGGALKIATAGTSTALTLGNTTGTTSLTFNTGSGGINIPSFSSNGVVVSSSAGVVTDLAAGTSGFILTSNGSGSLPSWLANSGTGFAWIDQTSSTVTIATANAYIMDDGATLITATLPTTAALGTEFKIVGKASGLWKIAQNSGQTIVFGNTTTTSGTGGSLASTLASDCVSIVCTTANNVFTVYNSMGNLTVV